MTIRSRFLCGAFALGFLAVPWSVRGARLVSVATCLQVSSAGDRCSQSTDQIPWESPEIHAIVVVGETRPETLVKLVWVSVDAIEPRNYVIQTEERKVGATGADVPLLFSIAKDEWPAGKYRIDLSLDGRVVRSLPFSVLKASAGGRTAGTPVAKWQPRQVPAVATAAPRPTPAPSTRTSPAPSATTELQPPVAPPASRPSASPPPALAPLAGSWVAQGPFGSLTLDFPVPGTLVLGGRSYTYTQSPDALRVLEEGIPTDYPYTLQDGILTLRFPQGFALAFLPEILADPTPWPALPGASLPPAVPAVPIPAPAESFLWGSFCTAPLLVGPGTMAIRWSEFSGTGQFTFGEDDGSPYGRVAQGGGTYAVVGETIQFRFADGSLGTGQVVVRQPDGRVGSLAYGPVVYSGGLCP